MANTQDSSNKGNCEYCEDTGDYKCNVSDHF
jgi:hypothetical protein